VNPRLIALLILTIIIMYVGGSMIFAQTVNTDRRGIAVDGYDVVAYFTLGEPTEGDAEITADYDGATYFFANPRHREIFLEDPEKYAPQYGGYCAYAVSQGGTAGIKPQLWAIHDDRLFLNFSNRTQRRFLEDIDQMVRDADANWPRIEAGLAED
jgi:YHS domain-containing protein